MTFPRSPRGDENACEWSREHARTTESGCSFQFSNVFSPTPNGLFFELSYSMPLTKRQTAFGSIVSIRRPAYLSSTTALAHRSTWMHPSSFRGTARAGNVSAGLHDCRIDRCFAPGIKGTVSVVWPLSDIRIARKCSEAWPFAIRPDFTEACHAVRLAGSPLPSGRGVD